MGKQTGSKLGKEYVKVVYCHPGYLTYMQRTSLQMLGWMKHKLEWRLLGKISITSDMQMTPTLWQKVKRTWRASWWKWKRTVKCWLKSQHSKNKDHGIQFHHSFIHYFISVAYLCPTLCDPMDNSPPSLPVHHQLPELTQTHVHWVSDDIQPSHPLSSPSPPHPFLLGGEETQ